MMLYKKIIVTGLIITMGNSTILRAQQNTNPFDQRVGVKKGNGNAAALLQAQCIRGRSDAPRTIAGSALHKPAGPAAQALVLERITDGQHPVPVFLKAQVEQKTKFKFYSVFEAGAVAGEYLQAVKDELLVKDATAEFVVSSISA